LSYQFKKTIMKKFEITSGKMVISDPCYAIPTWCQGVVERVKNGTWVSDVEKVQSWGERVSILFAINEQALKDNPNLKDELINSQNELPFTFGVDSGQLGFFDHEHYRNDNSATELPKYDFGDDYDVDGGDVWYRAVCDLTLASEQWGVLPFGVVSSSGYGDGSYPVFAVTNEYDEYIGFMAIFIGEDDEDYEDDED
jgi:hypothetical protein